MSSLRLFLLAALLVPSAVFAQERHPAMEKSWWVNAGIYWAARDFDASASGSVDGGSGPFDFEGVLGLNDAPDLFMGELGWKFTEKWSLTLQHFRSKRDASRVLEESFEWRGNLYEVGARLDASSSMSIDRIFFARRFRDDGPHSLRLGAGIHWLDLQAAVSGQATLNDQSTEFRRSVASASLPVPNIGAWYRYSSNDRWLVSARLDWLSASVGNYSGDIWNGSVSVNYRLGQYIGLGASYQYFELAGRLTEDSWRGKVKTSFSGPYLFLTAFW